MDAAKAELAVLQKIYDEIVGFDPSSTTTIPILDSSVDFSEDGKDIFKRDHVPGLRGFRESVKRDLDILLEVCPHLIAFSLLLSRTFSLSSLLTILSLSIGLLSRPIHRTSSRSGTKFYAHLRQ